jgi:hypothetical protein
MLIAELVLRRFPVSKRIWHIFHLVPSRPELWGLWPISQAVE